MVLAEFLNRSQFLHSIAFMQWRIKYEGRIPRDVDQLKENIQIMIKYLYDPLQKEMNDESIKELRAVKNGFGICRKNKNYHHIYQDALVSAAAHNVWSFEQLGLVDPYPKEKMEFEFTIP